MNEENYTAETDASIIDFVNKNIIRHTVQLFRKGKKRLQPFGSSVFVKLYDSYFFFTASHVADYFENNENSDLYIRVGKKRFVNVLGEIKYTDIKKSGGIDLAYIKIDSQLIGPLLGPYIPIEVNKIRSHHNLLNAMNYCVFGYPEVNISKEGEEFDTYATLYLTSPSKDNVYTYYGYKKKDTIVVEVSGKGKDIRTNLKSPVNTHFYGISGCGLWLMLLHFNELEKRTEVDYRLVGIMTEFKKGKFFCLAGNKIHLLIEALEAIEQFKFKEIPIAYS